MAYEPDHPYRDGLGAAATYPRPSARRNLQLPDMHGCDLALKLKANPRTRDVTLIAVSGAVDDIDRARELGFEGFMIKPASAAAIRKKVALVFREAYPL